MHFRVYKGKKINRFLCLFFILFAVIFLILAGVFALAKDPDKGYVFCILAIIAGGFSLLYGVFWFIYGRVERKSEKKLREILEGQNTTEDPNRLDYQEFILPKAALIKKAGKRAHDIVRWTGTFSNEQPFWAEYEQFVAALAEWGKKNRVQVVVSYMA